ncbi:MULTISPECIES: hypothetical protein [unclassified Herbaspirillum]|uniref:hypothetical protein n=1 Tax=unclassified Herbaspirillum TaxID=2624150 RepID=UPI001C5C875A|nr:MULTISPECIES: hypothetical protein [unclassified Herbaspirillum]
MRLKDVVARLYKAPKDGQRQAFALSRVDAERLPHLATMAVISITEPGRPLANLEGHEHVLRLSFADVDFLDGNISSRAKDKLKYAFTPEQAGRVTEFIERLPAEIASIVVHCEGGYSRSAAIVVALGMLHGYTVEPRQLTEANASIVKVMTKK